MDEFVRMNVMVKPDGSLMSIEDYSKLCFGGGEIEVYKNSTYMVIKKFMEDLIWLSIKRIDKEPIHDWRIFREWRDRTMTKELENYKTHALAWLDHSDGKLKTGDRVIIHHTIHRFEKREDGSEYMIEEVGKE
jgi:hypothetical protein